MTSMFKKDRSKIRILTNTLRMLRMVEKGIRAGICHVIHKCEGANNKYLKNYDKIIESS